MSAGAFFALCLIGFAVATGAYAASVPAGVAYGAWGALIVGAYVHHAWRTG